MGWSGSGITLFKLTACPIRPGSIILESSKSKEFRCVTSLITKDIEVEVIANIRIKLRVRGTIFIYR